MSMVLDASIAVQWFLGDERTSSADDLLNRVRTESAHVPALFRWEMQNVLLSAERASRIDAADVDDALDALRDLPIYIEPPKSRFFAGSEIALARVYKMTAYDAAYVALATSLRLPLATEDSRLAYAARDLGILVIS